MRHLAAGLLLLFTTACDTPAAGGPDAAQGDTPDSAALPDSAGGHLKIMPLGDSITLGVNGGYRDGLWTRLTGAGYTLDFVGSERDPYGHAPDQDHEGHPGFTIDGIATRIDGWLATHRPAIILLMIGTNDVAWWCAKSAAEVAAEHAGLVDRLLAAGATVVIATIPPLTSSISEPNKVDRAALAAAYNGELRTRIAARVAAGARVRLAEVERALVTGDLYDGVHPSEAAHEKVAQAWYEALRPLLP